jgi:hypothetical protein
MTFSDDLKKFQVKTQTRRQIVYEGSVAAALKSIKFGDSRTGSPGQPVESEDLRKSWTATTETPTTSIITHDKAYALSNEDGIARPGGGPYRLRSAVGGRWSVRATILGFSNIVDDIVARLGRR